MSKTIVIDFEGVDPHIKTLGPGYAYGAFTFVSACIHTDKGYEYFTDIQSVLDICTKAETIIAHNAQYDCGILAQYGIDLSKKEIICTQMLSNLHYNVVPGGHSLGNLAKHYLNDEKCNDPLGIAAAEIMPKNLDLSKGSNMKQAKTWAITHMDQMNHHFPKLVEEYCVHDVKLTKGLYDIFKKEADSIWVDKMSRLLKMLIRTRMKGVRIDIPGLLDEQKAIREKEVALLALMKHTAKKDFNPNSSAQVAEIFETFNIEVPTTAKGSPSVTLAWLKTVDNDLARQLCDYKKLTKIKTSFIDPYIDNQELLEPKYRGRIYPCLKPFQAITGRFACSNPNAQQIPPEIRRFILPEEGERIAEGDFSSQEGRLAVHYAHLTKCTGADILVEQFKEDPRLDLHEQGAKLCGVSRNESKAVNLGILYGMGITKLAEGLGTTANKAKVIKEKYNTNMPYISELANKCKKMSEKRGYLKTLLGRKTYADISFDGSDLSYKMINKLIQGSAADQAIEAMLQLDELGIEILFPIHDAIAFSYNDEKTVETVKKVMENCVKLEVPMITDIKTGSDWSECK